MSACTSDADGAAGRKDDRRETSDERAECCSACGEGPEGA